MEWKDQQLINLAKEKKNATEQNERLFDEVTRLKERIEEVEMENRVHLITMKAYITYIMEIEE